MIELEDDKFREVVIDNIIMNKYFSDKLEEEKSNIKMFKMKHAGKGNMLYNKQDEVFKGNDIIVAIEMNTSYIFVEGSSLLHDELVAFIGLDEKDITNYFLVAQYMICREKFKQ